MFVDKVRHVIHSASQSVPSVKKYLTDEEISAFAKQLLGGDSFMISGPLIWHRKVIIGQTTSAIAFRLIYNKKLDANIVVGSMRLVFVQAAFPDQESLEWWIIDILNCYFLLAQPVDYFVDILRGLLRRKSSISDRINMEALKLASEQYGTDATREALAKYNIFCT